MYHLCFIYSIYAEGDFYLPRKKAPDSTVKFWCKYLHIFETESIFLYATDHGYSSTEEIQADEIGYYEFYEEERYHLYLIYLSFNYNL